MQCMPAVLTIFGLSSVSALGRAARHMLGWSGPQPPEHTFSIQRSTGVHFEPTEPVTVHISHCMPTLAPGSFALRLQPHCSPRTNLWAVGNTLRVASSLGRHASLS